MEDEVEAMDNMQRETESGSLQAIKTICDHCIKFYFSHNGGWKVKIRVLVGLIDPEASFLGFQMAAFLLCRHMVF